MIFSQRIVLFQWLLCLLILIVGCQSPQTTPPVSSKDTVYVSGYYQDGTSSIPCYWKNGSRVDLPGTSTTGAYAVSICLEGTQPLLGGWVNNNTQGVPCIWQNGSKIDWPAGTVDTGDWGIAYDNGSIYLAGQAKDTGGVYTATIWKDQVKTALPGDGTHSSDANSVVIVNSHIFVGGYYSNGTQNVACYWKDGIRFDLASGSTGNAMVQSLTADSTGNVSFGGYYSDGTKLVPCIWTSNGRTDLVGDGVHDSQVIDLKVANGQTYASGYYGNGTNNIPCYWANGSRHDLLVANAKNGYARGIDIKDGDIYISGNYIDQNGISIACTWKNENRVDLPGDGVHLAAAYHVIVD